MSTDTYSEFAEKYDYMLSADGARTDFFKKVISKHRIKSILDCACGTGADLIMFRSIIGDVTGSDVSDAMIVVAKRKLAGAGYDDIKIKKADFRKLASSGLTGYDAIVCLSSSICELHSDKDAIEALRSMYGGLTANGILIIDQGQSDSMMNARPRFIPVLNNRDISRLFVIDYPDNSSEFITVNICDLVHTQEESGFGHAPFRLRIRLFDEWEKLLAIVGISNYEVYGSWDMVRYDKNISKRLIIKVMK